VKSIARRSRLRHGLANASDVSHFQFGIAALLLLVAVMVFVSGSPGAEAKDEAFAPNSPFRMPIANGAPVDPNSAGAMAKVAGDSAVYANLVDFGIPIYSTEASTPRYTVRCTITDWGPCPFDDYRVPVPDNARAADGSDGAMVVLDRAANLVYEFWQAKHSGENWTASFGAVNRFDGSGWGDGATGFATASGASRLAGVIRIAELQRQDIRHALALQSRYVCVHAFRAPAVKTDGTYAGTDCVPEGARVRLDPAVNLDALGLAPAVRTIAKTMQTYGGFVVDYGGAPLSLAFERDSTASGEFIGESYAVTGLRWDYDNLPGVPWDRLQLMA
jgi:hypothetical protein